MSFGDSPIIKPFNPLDKRNLGESVADALLDTTVQRLPPEPFIGAGVYALYYFGSFAAYNRLSEINRDGQYRCPISEERFPLVQEEADSGLRSIMVWLYLRDFQSTPNQYKRHAI